ncbi:Transcriptional regulator PadR-like family protein [Amycolatopsis xylanica]|uniref:Transcriptional regulator PadR-like family protein n=1 Tax=Amycolatopsis xylanica TaxID=589385 RepID=A0A1H3M419_9PSEU|nr:PadR family transcriptional regulator [Amycolatopsis xylanica]SDY71343.1 Transcriptional regulator PadR-like family protein [Amycolatopsis xylanica]
MGAPKQPLTPLAMAILELLHERPMHPYEMTQIMRYRRVDYRVKLRPGSLYHTVERLDGQGLIEVVDTQRQGRRPERTVYGMTEHGRDVFTAQVHQMVATPADEYPEFPVALSALGELTPEEAVEQLKMRVMNLRARLAADQVVIEQVTADNLPPMYWIDYAYSHHQRKSELDFTQQLIEDLESGRMPWPDESGHHLAIVKDEKNDKTG